MTAPATRLSFACALLTLAVASPGAAAPLGAPFPELPEVALEFDLGDPQAEWTVESRGTGSVRCAWRGFTLDLRLEKRGPQRRLGFELKPPKGGRLAVASYGARVTLPQSAAKAVMVPSQNKIARLLDYFGEHHAWPERHPLYRNLLNESFRQSAAANAEAPFILLTDDRGGNRYAVGWTAAPRGTSLEGKVDGDRYVLRLDRREDLPFAGESLKDELIVDTAARPWMETAGDYARAFDLANGTTHEPRPDWTLDPVYCTWYCYGDNINQEGVLKIARKCKELGFGTVLIDAGWDCRPQGGYIDWEKGILGDYEARPDRFPDMPGLVREIHAMGLRVMLWCAPFWEGRRSRAYREKTSTWHMRDRAGKELHELCPRHPEVRGHFRDRFAWIAKTYDIDGMWIDAADAVQGACHADHPHVDQPMGEAFVECAAACREGLRSVKPDAITEARVMHGNINTKRAFDAIQPSDAPESYEILRLAGIHIRPWAYDVNVKNDPMYWLKKTDAATVGKFLATMAVSGVPALSVDYLTASDEHCRLTRAWLTFYREHKTTLIRGAFSLFGADFSAPDMLIAGRDEAVVYVRNRETGAVALPVGVRRVIVLNCTDRDAVKLKLSGLTGRWRMSAFGPDWSRSGGPVDLTGAMIDGPVPQGGAAVVERP